MEEKEETDLEMIKRVFIDQANLGEIELGPEPTHIFIRGKWQKILKTDKENERERYLKSCKVN